MKPVYKKSIVPLIAIIGILSAGFIALKLNSIINETTTIPKRPNLLLITLDNLRPDHLSIYGYQRDTSPAISGLAGFVFDNAFTVSTNSGPSHATMLTGLYPPQHGLIDNGQSINSRVPTLAVTLRDRGYDTAGFVGYYALSEESGLDKGFQTFELHPIASHDHDEKSLDDDLAGFVATKRWLGKWIGESKKSRNPFFIWMHVQNIHESYDPAPPYNSLFQEFPVFQKLKGKDFDLRCANDIAKAWRSGIFPDHLKDEVIALYDGEIRLVDDQLKKIFETLKNAEIYDDTLIVVLSDHGEILFEKYEHEFFKRGPGHSSRYTDSAIRIPLVIKPAGAPQSDHVLRPASLVSTIDLMPTILDMMNIEPVPWMSGKSLVPLMDASEPSDPDQKIFIHDYPYETEFLGVRTSDWKLVIKTDEGVENKLLIDIKNDPEENRNVWAENFQKGEELKSLLISWKKKNKSTNLTAARELSEKMRQALQDGGYIRK